MSKQPKQPLQTFPYLDKNGNGTFTKTSQKNPYFNPHPLDPYLVPGLPGAPATATSSAGSPLPPGVTVSGAPAAGVGDFNNLPPTSGIGNQILNPYDSLNKKLVDIRSGLPAQSFNVYMGDHTPSTSPVDRNQPGDTGPVPNYASYSRYEDLLSTLDSYAPGSAQIKALQKKLYDAGIISSHDKSGRSDDATRRAYGNVLQDVSAYNQNHMDAQLTPDAYLARAAQANKATGGHSMSRTDTRVNLSDPITAGVIVNKVLMNYNHRGATPQEKAAFVAALNAFQSANPVTTTSQIDTNTGLETSSKTVDKTASPGDYAEAYAQTGAMGTEGNTNRVATDYYTAALQAIGASGGK